ncbi:TPA: transposase [Klebsiella pneumoniae]|nr:transposase [Klebsiella pneumoniae]
MSDSLRPRRVRASYSMDFKLELVEKSYQPGACVAQLAREHGINDNLLFTWRQRYSHLLPDEIQRSVSKPDAVIPVVVSDMSLSHHAEPHYEPSGSAYSEVMTCEVAVGSASLRLTGNLSPAILKTLLRELTGRGR